MNTATRRFAAFVSAVTALALGETCAAPAEASPPLKNGVALHGPLTWGKTDPDRTTYAWPLYEDPRYDVPVALLRKVKAAGFDFIRLTVDPGPLLAFKGAQRDELDRRMTDTIARIRDTGLDVLVDFAPIRMVKPYAAEHLETDLFPAYTDMIRHSARMLTGLGTDHIAIEPMNEPQQDGPKWQEKMKSLYGAVRAESPEMTVIVTGGRGGGLDGLLALDPTPFAGDANVRFSLHYYLPYIFSHEGVLTSVKHARIWAYTTGLPYPAKPEQLAEFWALVKTRVQAANLPPGEEAEILADGSRQLDDYFNGQGTRAGIAANLDRVSGWADSHHIPPARIFVGEFGATQKSPSHDGALPQDRARWLSDVRQEIEGRGFRWSLWNLNDKGSGGMTLVSATDDTAIDPTTAAAVGMRPTSH
jgi:endoglucanase